MKKSLLFFFSLTLVFALTGSRLQAQVRTVTGTVTSAEDGAPLPGVSIAERGTSNGTVTDVNGKYSLNLTTDGATLVFSFVGLVTQEVNTSGKNVIDVPLAQDMTQLSEVVVVGYGTQEHRDVTGSVVQVKGSDLQNLPVTSFEQALQGRAPGVQISSSSGELGSVQRIRIRGASSVTANNQPLIVIDGFVVTSTDQGNFSDSNASNPMADLNMNDVESYNVLTDASAAAIYGSRASNGVIIIKTKRGAQGKTKFNVNYSTGFSKPTHTRTFLNRDQYIEMFTEAVKNSPGFSADPAGLDFAWNYFGGGPRSGPGSFSDLVANGANTNWNDYAFQTGHISQYDLSATGGTDKTKFFASVSYLDQDGIIVGNTMNRLSARVNLDQTVTQNLKFGLSINQIYNLRNNVAENNTFNSPLEANALAPIIPFLDATGDYNDNTFYANPFRALHNYKDKSTQWRNFSNVYGSWDIVKGLNFRSEFGVDYLGLYEYGWQGAKFPTSAGTPSAGKYGTSRVINYSVNNTLTYTKDIADKHSLEVLLGQSYQQSNGEFAFMQGQGLPSDFFKYLGNASQNSSFSSSTTAFSYTSVFARANYKLNNRYLVSASIRNDGSSRFGADTRYGWFPAASAGWIMSEEDFIKNSGVGNTLNFFKIKASIGVTGNSEIADYASRALYASTFFGGRGGVMPRQLPNPDLSWEKTTQTDVGVEYELFGSRIAGGADYYVKNTKDLLLSLPIDPTSGYTSTLRNLGTMTNKGWDLYINTKNLVGKLKWSTSFNFSAYKNEITDISGQPILPTGRALNAAIVGQPLGVFYGVEYAGVDPTSGNALFRLADGTTTTSWSKASSPDNFRVLGNPNPKNYGGITNTFEYMNFDLTVFGQWSYGNDIFLSSGVFQSSGMTNFGLDNQTVDQLNYWRADRPNTDVPRPVLYGNSGARTSSRYLSDGSYFRFKTITLGYTIPRSMTDRIRFSSVRIYATAQNLFTITNYKGNDPEVNYVAPSSTTQSTNLTNGVDYYGGPQAKSIIFGIKLGF